MRALSVPLPRRASAGFLRRHPGQLALALLGVALGVAVVVSIDLVRSSARDAFEQSMQTITGEATHQVLGGSTGVNEALYARLRQALPGLAMAPVLETSLSSEVSGERRRFRLLGVDPFAEGDVRAVWRTGGGAAVLQGAALLVEPGAVLASTAGAERLGLSGAGRFQARVAGRLQELRLTAVLPLPADTGAAADLLLADIATVQELLGRPGRLTRIDIRLQPGQEALLSRLAEALPEGHTLVATRTRSQSVLALSDAFYTNLRALSLLALLVGMFLIYNTQSFLVVQRRTLLGQLRCLGVTPAEVRRLVLGEAALLGALGGALGLGLGVLLAETLLGLVTRTLNDLYFQVEARTVHLDLHVMARAFALGLLASVAAAWTPAREAGRVQPRAGLSRISQERATRAGLRRGAWAALACALASMALAALPGESMVSGFAALFALMLATALATPLALLGLVRVLEPAGTRLFGLPGRLAVSGVTASLSRTSVAISALMVAVATTIGMGLMIASFRGAVDSWLQTVLQADVYLTAEQAGDPLASPFDTALVQRLQALEGVAAVSHVRRLDIPGARGPTRLAAYALVPRARAGFAFIAGQPETLWPRFDRGEGVLLTEPYAFRHGLSVGDTLQLGTDTGTRPFEVLGIYRDYGDEQGSVAMSRAAFERHYRDRGISGIGIYAAPGMPPARLAAVLDTATHGIEGLRTVDRNALREISLSVFDRTFAITEVMRLLAAVIACVGILSALMALQLERRRELGIYRALGFSRGQLGGLLIAQCALMGFIAGLVALPTGAAMATVLVHVINRRSFGWSMPLALDAALLLQGLLLAVVAAVLAGLYPAWRMARLAPAQALRAE